MSYLTSPSRTKHSQKILLAMSWLYIMKGSEYAKDRIMDLSNRLWEDKYKIYPMNSAERISALKEIHLLASMFPELSSQQSDPLN